MRRTAFFFLFILLVFFFLILTFSTCSESTDPNPHTEVIKWDFGSPQTVLTSGTSGSWDDHHVGWASVILDSDTLKMWYSASNASDNIWAIGYAWSLDGLSWTRYSGNPVMTKTYTWERDIGQPVVIKDGNLYRMWYQGWVGAEPVVVGYATSPDGKNWTKRENPVMDITFGSGEKTQIGLWSVLKIGSSFAGWYYWTDENWNDHWTSGKGFTGYASSSDGISWEDHGTCLSCSGSGWDADFAITPLVTNSDITLNNETISYHMLYLGFDTDSREPSIGYASSQDTYAFKKYEMNPVKWYLDLHTISGSGITLSSVLCDWPETGDFHVWYTESPYGGISSRLNYLKGKLTVEEVEVQ